MSNPRNGDIFQVQERMRGDESAAMRALREVRAQANFVTTGDGGELTRDYVWWLIEKTMIYGSAVGLLYLIVERFHIGGV